MTWLMLVGFAWVALAVPAALVIGRAIRESDQRWTCAAPAEDVRWHGHGAATASGPPPRPAHPFGVTSAPGRR